MIWILAIACCVLFCVCCTFWSIAREHLFDAQRMRRDRDEAIERARRAESKYETERSRRRNAEEDDTKLADRDAGATLQALLRTHAGGPPTTIHLTREDYVILGLLDVPNNVTLTWEPETPPNFYVIDPIGCEVRS